MRARATAIGEEHIMSNIPALFMNTTSFPAMKSGMDASVRYPPVVPAE